MGEIVTRLYCLLKRIDHAVRPMILALKATHKLAERRPIHFQTLSIAWGAAAGDVRHSERLSLPRYVPRSGFRLGFPQFKPLRPEV